MDYEKKYNEALKDMRAIYPNLKGDAKLAVEHAFPELRESEDERIRKAIIELLKEVGRDDTGISENAKCMIAYLEKQKEQKPAEWKPTEEQFNYLAKAIMTLDEIGDCRTAGVLSEIRNGLKCSFPDWKKSSDYPKEGCNVSLNGEIKKIQEWSEEDK